MAKVKCACGPCNCEVEESKAYEKDGKLYCSESCAHDRCITDTGHNCGCSCSH